MDTLPWFSNTGLQVVPAFSVFQAPPGADAAKMTRVSRGSMAKAGMDDFTSKSVSSERMAEAWERYFPLLDVASDSHVAQGVETRATPYH